MKYYELKEDKELFKSVTGYELAKRTGITSSYISMLVKGKRSAMPKTYKKLREAKDRINEEKREKLDKV